MIEIRVYTTQNGKFPFQKWLSGIDIQAQHRVQIAIDRLADGNTGNLKSVGNGVHEIMTDLWCWYSHLSRQRRRYNRHSFAWRHQKRQSDDLAKAKELWRDYLNEMKQ